MKDRAKDMLSIERGAKDLPIDRKKKKGGTNKVDRRANRLQSFDPILQFAGYKILRMQNV